MPQSFYYVSFVVLALFWGGSFVAIKGVLAQIPPFHGAAYRIGFSLVFLLLFRWALKEKRGRLSWSARRRIWVAGLFSLGFPFCFLFWGQKYIPAGLAGIINGTVPIWTYILGRFYFKTVESQSIRKLTGLCLGFFGMAVIFGPLLEFQGHRMEFFGALSVLAMAVSYGIGGLLTREIVSVAKIDLFSNAIEQHAASFIFLILFASALEPIPSISMLVSSRQAMGCLLYLSFCSTALALLMYTLLMREWGIVRASVVLYLIPLCAMMWDALFFGNFPRANQILGASVILFGVALIQWPFKSKKKLSQN